MLVAAAAGGYRAWRHPSTTLGAAQAPAGKAFAVRSVNGLTVSFILPKGELRMVENTLVIEFREESSGRLVDVGTVKFALDMNMPGMVMHSGSAITPGDAPGRYTAKVTPDMGGEWVAQLHYEGPRGSGAVNFRVQVEP
jgi:YtkA-like